MSESDLDEEAPVGGEALGRTSFSCVACRRGVLAKESMPCPFCADARVEPAGVDLEGAQLERMLPFQVDADTALRALSAYARPRWFKTQQLARVASMRDRLRRVWVPCWLVDVDVVADWEAEAGYDYEVKSSREHYVAGKWTTQEVMETRIRWEHRCGTARRHVDNALAHGLTDMERLVERVGSWNIEPSEPVRDDGSAILVPDMTRHTAWLRAEGSVRNRVAAVAHQAIQSDHLREFRWNADFEGAHWTWLLLPVYVTWYADDKGRPWPLWVHGQTGKVAGARMASVWRGGGCAAIIATTALTSFCLGLVVALGAMAFPPLLAVSLVIVVLSVVFGCLAVWPVAGTWRRNTLETKTWHGGM